jgi:hypothetical protein
MKILKIIRLYMAAVLIGLSCIMPNPISDTKPKYLTEQKESLDDDEE